MIHNDHANKADDLQPQKLWWLNAFSWSILEEMDSKEYGESDIDVRV